MAKNKKITFEDFEQTWLTKIKVNKPEELRLGQALMQFLSETWPKEYKRIVNNHYHCPDLDCFYTDVFITNLMSHLQSVWQIYPK